ncbi:MAG: peptide ABC transporter substrate-binding protein [Gemmatimonadota bacterium]
MPVPTFGAGMRPVRTLLALLVVCLGGCSGPDGGSEGSKEPTTVTVLDPAYEVIFNPIWDMPAKFLLYLPMVGFDANGGIVPRLARSWEHSEDYRTWTYHLRPDARWHDGVPVTAHDVKFSIELQARREIGYYDPVESIVIQDDTTITIRTEGPVELDWWTVYYPKHLLESLDPTEFFQWEFWSRPVGNGPYRYARHQPRSFWEMEANRDYLDGKPAVDRLIIKFGADTAVPQLLSGQVDAATFVRREHLEQLKADPRYDVFYAIWPDVGWLEGLFLNLNHPFLSDPVVRRALTLAIDRRELRTLQRVPEEFPIFDVFFSGRQFWRGETPDPLPYDIAEARRLLESRGWIDRDGDGVRERNATKARFTALVASAGPAQTHSYGQAAVYVQAAFRDVGIEMQILTLESGVRDRLRSGDADAGFFRILQHPDYLIGIFRDADLGWSHPVIEAALLRMRETEDPEERDSLFASMVNPMREHRPILLLSPQVQWFVAHERIKGFSSPFRARTLMHLEHVWLDE